MESPQLPRRRLPPLAIVVAALGLVVIHSWFLHNALEGVPIRRGWLTLNVAGRWLSWLVWAVTAGLAAVALWPSRDP